MSYELSRSGGGGADIAGDCGDQEDGATEFHGNIVKPFLTSAVIVAVMGAESARAEYET